jgi:nicotinamidase-related amidase
MALKVLLVLAMVASAEAMKKNQEEQKVVKKVEGKETTPLGPKADPNDVCAVELKAAGDFLAQLGYKPTSKCCANTKYMQARRSSGFLSKPETCVGGEVVKAEDGAAMFVIDMQNDFTTGSFKLPCEEVRANKLATDIAAKMISFAKAGGLVVLSKDYHPPGHCSFMKLGASGPRDKDKSKCEATKGHADVTDATECECRNTLADSDLAKSQVEARYMNAFPSHTVENTDGSQFDPIIMKAVKKIASNAEYKKPVVIYKGFAPLYDSFSAFPHVTSAATAGRKHRAMREARVTGGWATSRYKSATDADICEVTEADVKEIHDHLDAKYDEPGAKPSKLVSVNKIMKENEIKHVYVTGLVFDFCVKETSIFALKNAESKKNGIESVTLLADLAAPAMEGKPGLLGPLATSDYLKGVAADLKKEKVCVVESGPRKKVVPGEKTTTPKADKTAAKSSNTKTAKAETRGKLYRTGKLTSPAASLRGTAV